MNDVNGSNKKNNQEKKIIGTIMRVYYTHNIYIYWNFIENVCIRILKITRKFSRFIIISSNEKSITRERKKNGRYIYIYIRILSKLLFFLQNQNIKNKVRLFQEN